jgi:hypothetical protein
MPATPEQVHAFTLSLQTRRDIANRWLELLDTETQTRCAWRDVDPDTNTPCYCVIGLAMQAAADHGIGEWINVARPDEEEWLRYTHQPFGVGFDGIAPVLIELGVVTEDVYGPDGYALIHECDLINMNDTQGVPFSRFKEDILPPRLESLFAPE